MTINLMQTKALHMKTFYTSLLILIFSGNNFAQNVMWVKKESGPSMTKNMLCDLDSNLYIYGSNQLSGVDPALPWFSYSLADTSGTYIEKFSPQGNLLLYKKWSNKTFFIQKIIYDGAQYFYFTGFFGGSFTVDGISLSSKGGADGMIGKMDSNGNILWINTFGSSKDEVAQGICFNTSKTSLIITGSVTDSLKINNAYIDKGNQSALIARFSLTGTLQSHRLYDFLPQRNNIYGTEEGMGNCGREIVSDLIGNFFILTDREGKHSPCCSNDTLNAPEQGVYITKLNNNLDTLWSKFIIGPGCYYGWDLGNLAISDYGDPYITGYCSSHYGGNGFVERLNQNTGAIAWNDDRMDGGYQGIFLEGNTLYTCGTDSATYCPCPDQHQGYQTLKKFDQNNTLQSNLKFNGSVNFNNELTFRKITRDSYGNSYVYGDFYAPYAVFGNDTLFNSTSSYGFFLMKLSDNAIVTSVTHNEANIPFTIFPNPTTGIVDIHFSGNRNETTRFNIIDVMGRTIYSETLQQGILNKTIDLSKEAKGLYLIEATTGKEKNYKKIVIE